MTRLLSWWRAGQLKRLAAGARSAAIAYQMARVRYENAVVEEQMRREV